MEDLQIHLVELAKKGDVQAFGQLYEMVWKDLYRYALYCLGDRESAEDLVQDTAIEAFRGIHNLKNNEAFKTWIFRILTLQSKRKIKKIIQLKQVKTLDDYKNLPDEKAELDSLNDAIILREAISNLSFDEKTIILLSIVKGLKSHEIAQILGKPEGTIRSKQHRALSKLRIKLEKEC